MANKPAVPVVAGPDAAIIAALASNPAALAAYMGAFSTPKTAPTVATKVSPAATVSPDDAKRMFLASIKNVVIKPSAVKGKPYAVISFTHVNGRNGAACFWLS